MVPGSSTCMLGSHQAAPPPPPCSVGAALQPNHLQTLRRTSSPRSDSGKLLFDSWRQMCENLKEGSASCFSHAHIFSLPLLHCLVLVARLGASQRGGGFHGDSATKLPGQRPRGLRDGSEEVHRVLHLGAVLHDARRRPPQPAQSCEDA